jgi:uncharacterized protein (TIGR01319 family)
LAETTRFDTSKINVILATDCGSTTSKARFFKKLGNEYRFVASGEAPTTVEAPYEDVTLGVRNAVREIEELTGHRLLSDEGILMPSQENAGTDLYVTTSSAGGGLQMMVTGVIKTMTAESAERAALGAGSIVMDVMSVDDGRKTFQKIDRIRRLRPDMILISGGTDGGTTRHVFGIAELISTAEPKARLGVGYELPIVYAGNKEARDQVKKILGNKFALRVVDNIRPSLSHENPDPARDAIHELFMEHVMSHAPGYDRLMKWTSVPIMPTPAGEGKMFRTLAEMRDVNVIGVGLGGATTNVYSVYERRFVRTVSANLGMSYSICNVLKEAGIQSIMRWLPFEMDEIVVRNRLRNKMIRPTVIPQLIDALVLEHAVAREALRLGFAHHKSLARGLRGIQRQRDVGDLFEQSMEEETYINMMKVNIIAGTGGLLSHAPRRAQTAIILTDAFQPEGVTRLAQDSVFMMPHLGVLSTVHPQAAMEIFEKDCLVRIGTCIAPKGHIEESESQIATVELTLPNGNSSTEEIKQGEIKRITLGEGQLAEAKIKPRSNMDVGAGPGRELETKIEGGVVGIVLDGRGRPIVLSEDHMARKQQLIKWFRAIDAYPQEALDRYETDLS